MAQAEADRHEIQPERHRRASLRDGRRTPPTAGGPEPIQFLFAKRPAGSLRPWARPRRRAARASLGDGGRTPPTAGGPEPIQFLFAKRPAVALRPWVRHGSRCRDLLAIRVEGGLSRREIEPDPDTSGGQGRAALAAVRFT